MYNRQGRKEEAYLYKALKLSGSLQIGEEEKSEQIRKIMEISSIPDPSDSVHRMEDVEHTGAGYDKCGRILLWNGRRNCGCNMAVGGKKTCVSGRSTGNCHGNDRDSLCDAVFPIPDV